MENSFQTSFIPKKSIVADTRVTPKSSTSLFAIISVFILVVVGVSAGGLFVYKSYLTKQKEILAASLAKAGDNFDKDTIAQLQLFDKRETASKKILNAHLVFSPLFSLIGQVTIPSVQYTTFQENSTNGKTFSVTMNGIAVDYKSVALQAGVFNTLQAKYFKNVVFSNLTRDKNNYITFNLNFDVDPTLLSYQKNVMLEQSLAPLPTPTQNQTPTPITNTPQ
jgi:hypothetical protein